MLASRSNLVRMCLSLCPYPSLLTSCPPPPHWTFSSSDQPTVPNVSAGTILRNFSPPTTFPSRRLGSHGMFHVPLEVQVWLCAITIQHSFLQYTPNFVLGQSYALLSNRILPKGPSLTLSFFSGFGIRLLSVYVSRPEWEWKFLAFPSRTRN